MKQLLAVTACFFILGLTVTRTAAQSGPAEVKARLTGLRSMSYQECRFFLDTRQFESKEELLQLFYILYFDGTADSIALERETIALLREKVQTFFPLRSCIRITYAGNHLTLWFSKRQTVYIPGTWHQASLIMSPKIEFRVYPMDDDPDMLVYEILSGGVLITTSRFLRRFMPFAIDVEGNSLFYKMDLADRSSEIGLKHGLTVPGDRIRVRQGDGMVWADVELPNLPDTLDLYFKKNELYYFGITIRLPEEGVVQCNHYRPERKPSGYRWFERMISRVLADPEGVLGKGVKRTIRVTYNLERRRIRFWQGFDILR